MLITFALLLNSKVHTVKHNTTNLKGSNNGPPCCCDITEEYTGLLRGDEAEQNLDSSSSQVPNHNRFSLEHHDMCTRSLHLPGWAQMRRWFIGYFYGQYVM